MQNYRPYIVLKHDFICLLVMMYIVRNAPILSIISWSEYMWCIHYKCIHLLSVLVQYKGILEK